jgi:lantibiotic modifying enzyme
MLFDASEHEALTEAPWDADAARAFVTGIVRDTDAAFVAKYGWPVHPEDDETGTPPSQGIYYGNAGTMWALTHLASQNDIQLRNDYAKAIAWCAREYQKGGDAVPSYFIGTVGVLLAQYAIAKDTAALDGIAVAIRANLDNPTREPLWGSPGTILAALLLRERASGHGYEHLIRDVQAELWRTWETDGAAAFLWQQDLYGSRTHYIGAAHGAVGNLIPLVRALDLLTPEHRTVVRERIAALLEMYAIREAGRANWWARADPKGGNAVQWCHGAPGVIISLAAYPSDDERVEQMLVAGGECIWHAGPLRKGPTLCHGTAGNGFALLRLAQRTGDDRWRVRARDFAMHAMHQVSKWREEFGMPAASLWTGELGVAAYVDAVLRDDPRILSLDIM